MVLHRFLLSIAIVANLPRATANPIRVQTLDAGTITTVMLGTDEPTTCLFPGAPTALEGANVATQPGEGIAVLLSHQPGTRFFSLRALGSDITAGLNVVYRNRVYALRLIAGQEADRSVTFLDKLMPLTEERQQVLLEQAKLHAWHTLPGVRFTPHTVTRYREFEVTLEEVFRHETDNALVFHVRFDNRTAQPVHYRADGLGVRVGRECWTAASVDASGAIPANGTSHAYFLVTTGLPAGAPFSIIVPGL